MALTLALDQVGLAPAGSSNPRENARRDGLPADVGGGKAAEISVTLTGFPIGSALDVELMSVPRLPTPDTNIGTSPAESPVGSGVFKFTPDALRYGKFRIRATATRSGGIVEEMIRTFAFASPNKGIVPPAFNERGARDASLINEGDDVKARTEDNSGVAGGTVDAYYDFLLAIAKAVEEDTPGAIDHGALAGLGDDDHTQYSLVGGTRAFTGPVGGVAPVAGADLITLAHHRDVSGVDAHTPYRQTFAGPAARIADATVYVAADVNKKALQLDNGTEWYLASIGPTTWKPTGRGVLAIVALAGPGPVDLQPGKFYNYDASGGAFTARMPGHASNPDGATEGDELWFFESGGPPSSTESMNALTLDAGTNALSAPWSLDGIGATQVIRSRSVLFGYKFTAAFGGLWARIGWQADGAVTTPNSPHNATGSPHDLAPFNLNKFDGSAIQTLNHNGSPKNGEVGRILESAGSGAAAVTVSGNGNNLINDAGASVASFVLSTARAYRQWEFTGSIWEMTGRVN